MKPLKILHLNNVAEVGTILSNQQTNAGLNSEHIDLIKPFGKRHSLFKIIGSPIRLIHALCLRIKIFWGDYDVVHVHYTTSAFLFIGIKSKLVVHAHGTDIRDRHKNKFRFLINKITLSSADLVFYSTPDLKAHLDRYQVKAIFIPNPLDLENFFETQAPETPSLFIHAAISEIKGASILKEALNKILNRFPDLKISYLGFGDRLADIQHLNLNQLPKLERTNLKDYISAHGLVLGQFKVGAIGMSELEALSCNRPVICHFEYDNAYKNPPPFYKAKTADEIFSHVESYLNDPEFSLRFKRPYRDWVIENHSKEKIERMVYGHYLTLF